MTLKGGLLNVNIEGGLLSGPLRNITFAGSITVDGVGVVRDVLVYRSRRTDQPHKTTSNEDGSWSIVISGSAAEEFMAICCGISGENSVIYSGIQGESSGTYTPPELTAIDFAMAGGSVESFSAKSVIFDIADNHGAFDYIEIRQIDFYYSGSKIAMDPATDYVAYTSSIYGATREAEFAFDTSLSKTGGAEYNAWMSAITNYTEERLQIVFTSLTNFDEIRINNGHGANTEGGTKTSRGAKNVKIHISTDSITSTVYNSAISNSTLIFDGVWDEHIASDVEDEQVLVLITPWADLWTPASITTTHWIDAADSDTISIVTDPNISGVSDKSGNGNDLSQETVADRPSIALSALNDLPVIEFDSSNTESLNMATAVDILDQFMCIVWKTDVTAINQIWSHQSLNVQFRTSSGVFQTTGSPAIFGTTAWSIGITAGEYNLMVFDANSEGAECFINGLSTGQTSDAQSASVYINAFGARSGSSECLDGAIAESIIVSRTEDREKIEGYLAWKWGLEDKLPITHTYKDAAPLAASAVISGIVTELEVAVARTVRAYDRDTGELLDETVSDSADGSYTLSPGSSENVFVVAFDDDYGTDYNAVILDKITP